MILGYDVSNFSGLPPDGWVWTAKNRFQLRRVVIGLQDLSIATAWAEAAHSAAVEVEAYVETPFSQPIVDQLTAPDVAAWCKHYNPSSLAFTLEDTGSVPPSRTQLAQAIDAAAAMLGYHADVPCYSGAWWWQQAGHALDISGLAPLWIASYTGSPPQTGAAFDVSMGGWVHARSVQYAGNVQLMGVQVDLDAWEV